ncbi:MAG: hemolysin family protein [bacterium]|nr:hemolysin family protein [bacterium]MDD3806050.1 hemolysin family protein [bacterium]
MDEPGSMLQLGLLFLLLLLSATFSGTETAFFAVNKVKMQNLLGDKWRRQKALSMIIEHPQKMLAALLVGNTSVNIIASVLVASISLKIWGDVYSDRWVALIATGITTTLLLLFGEVTPKIIAAVFAERVTLLMAGPIYVFSLVLTPVIAVINWISHGIIRLSGGRITDVAAPLVTEEEIRTAVTLGEEAGELEEEEKEMIHSIFEFGDTSAHEVMVPRTDMTAIDVTVPLKEALDLVLDTGHSRIPVYEDTVDNVIGIIYARDLLACMRDRHTEVGIRETMRPAYYVPEAKKVDDLLRELRRRRVHMAIVIDEYGGTAGLVTIEDLLEEIVGEIRDEYDIQEEELFRILDENTYLVDGRMSIDEINEMLDVRIPKDGFDSIGGYIFSEIGDIPGVGERLGLPDLGLELVIDKTDGRRISKVKIIKHPAQAEEEEQ